MMAPSAKYTIRLNYSGNSSIVLRSPDDDERDILIAETHSVNVGGIVLKKTPIATKRVPRKILSTMETPQINIPSPVSPISDTPSEDSPVNMMEEKPVPRESSIITPMTPEISPTTTTPLLNINEIAKASTNES